MKDLKDTCKLAVVHVRKLHITQPTLSRQIAALEEELGTPLFERNNKKITLTKEGILLKRRALEILELEEKTVEEIQSCRELVEGSVTIGCGEYEAIETLAEICASFRSKYPKVQLHLHTATAHFFIVYFLVTTRSVAAVACHENRRFNHE